MFGKSALELQGYAHFLNIKAKLSFFCELTMLKKYIYSLYNECKSIFNFE